MCNHLENRTFSGAKLLPESMRDADIVPSFINKATVDVHYFVL